MALDTRYLKKHGNQWLVVMKVPDRLRPILGKAHLKRPLHTDSLAIANRDKFKHLAEMREELERAEKGARQQAGRPADALIEDALGWRESFPTDDDDGGPEGSDEHEHGGVTVSEAFSMLISERADEITRREGYARGKQFYDVATGSATPIAPLVERWLTERPMKPRQTIDYRRAVLKFLAWVTASKLPAAVEGCTRRIAGRYVSEAMVATGVNWRTANKDISCLSSLWKWLEAKDYASENIWARQSLKKLEPKKGEGKRPYTDQEMVALFRGNPSPMLADMMAIAALSGMRIEEIAKLTVADIYDGRFDIQTAKTKAGVRMVPIHSALQGIVGRRMTGKEANDHLFPELPTPKAGSAVEQSQKAVKAFGAYRRRIGVDDVPEGARQSCVDFHSFRRWFITKAEQAHQPPHFISSLVGHKRSGETLGRYSAGPLVQQMRNVVESVGLPEGCGLAADQ